MFNNFNNNIKLAISAVLISALMLPAVSLDASARGGNRGMGGWGRRGQFARRHPRRAEVLGRDNNLNRSLNRDKGHLGGNYGKLEQQDRSIRQQEQADAKANGGYITRQQQQHFNQEENQLRNQVNQDYTGKGGRLGRGENSKWDKFQDKHPRRAEVLGRDNNINRSINQDKGHLGGNYGKLEQQDKSIRQQEQADAKANGGFITKQQRQQFNQEENQLRQQVNQDYNPR